VQVFPPGQPCSFSDNGSMSQEAAIQKTPSRFTIDGGKRIDKDTYDRMYAAYAEQQSASYVVTRCGVSRETADRTIKHGYPRRGWAPLRERLEAVHTEAARLEDYDLVQANRESLQAVRAYKQRFLERFKKAGIEDGEVNLATLEKIIKLETSLLGGADQRIQVAGNIDHNHTHGIDMSRIPEHMLERFCRTGEWTVEMDRMAEGTYEPKG